MFADYDFITTILQARFSKTKRVADARMNERSDDLVLI